MRNHTNQATRTKSQLKFVRRLNQTEVSGSRLMSLAEAVHSVPDIERDFEGIAITAIKFFSGDPDAVLSAYYRMQALADIVSQGVPGWAGEKSADGGIKTHPALFEAAGRARLNWAGNELRFRRTSFLRIAFQEAKLILHKP